MGRRKKTVLISGYFDPLHIGHIDLIKRAKQLGDHLIVVVNTDQQATLKKSKPFMPQDERVEIMKSLSLVDEVVLSIDVDRTICKTLEMIKPDIFANGGDLIRDEKRIPEYHVCKILGIQMVNNLGEKLQSSSKLTGLPGTQDKKEIRHQTT